MKYFLIGILCTIMCKVLFPYSPTTFYKQELSIFTSTSMLGDDDSDKDLLVFRAEKENICNYLLYFLICENEETDEADDEDGGSDEILQKKSFHLTSVTNDPSNFLDAHCVVAIPFFILFHSWKCFLV